MTPSECLCCSVSDVGIESYSLRKTMDPQVLIWDAETLPRIFRKPAQASKKDNDIIFCSRFIFCSLLHGLKQFCFQAVDLILFTAKWEAGNQMSTLLSCSSAYQAGHGPAVVTLRLKCLNSELRVPVKRQTGHPYCNATQRQKERGRVDYQTWAGHRSSYSRGLECLYVI